VLSRPSRPGQDPAGLVGAVYDWQHATVAAARLPAPGRLDPVVPAAAAGRLLALAQILLQAHTDSAGDDAATTSTVQRIRRAGAGWNATAQLWRHTATGSTTISPQLPQATAALDRAVGQFARTPGGSGWASPEQLRGRAAPDVALAVARGALAAVAAVADEHAALVARLGRTGALYTQVRHLPVPDGREEPEQRVADRLAGRWVPLSTAQSAPLVALYQQLPVATDRARVAYTALTDPPAGRRHPQERLLPPAATAPDPGAPVRPGLPEPVPVTLAGQRWRDAVAAVDPRLLDDPHYPALAAALDRVALAGADVTTSLSAAAARPLPPAHTARALHSRLVEACPAALTPATLTPIPPAPTIPPIPPCSHTTGSQGVSPAVRPRAAGPTPRR